ncbi:MAG TPA: acyltransferase family protein [Streptosporangiaceae bacterium]
MPEPVRTGQRYMPGLDGLRAIAVLAVIAFHEQFGWAPGGLLGVGVFFTLSGYLITDLLLGHWSARGTLALSDFWLRRARRLLPALFVMLVVVTAWVTLGSRGQLPSLRPAVAAATTYSSNWFLIASHNSYFARFAPPAPLDHLWSLAVEEQFYLAWPWLLLLGLRLVPRRDGAVKWLALPTMALAAASTFAMLVLYHPGLDPTRVYEGTDTRAAGLLIGAALAMMWPSRGRTLPGRAGRLVLDGAGIAGLVAIGLMIWRTGQYSPFIYKGGIVLLSAATAAAIAASACPGALTGRLLGWAPLRWIGVRSYGIYLWHFPVIVLTTPANSTENLVRAAAQTGASVILAALSWRYVEEPIRHGALGRAWARARMGRQPVLATSQGTLGAGRAGGAGPATPAAGSGAASTGHGPGRGSQGPAGTRPGPAGPGRPRPGASGRGPGRTRTASGRRSGGGGAARAGAVAAAAGSVAVLAVACAGLAGLIKPSAGASASPSSLAAGSALPAAPSPAPASTQGAQTGGPNDSAQSAGNGDNPSPTGAGGLRTSCKSVAHIGDSTSEGMVSRDYLPKAAERLNAQYQDVGVQQVRTNIVGANSVVETLPGDVNGYQAAVDMSHHGYRGCWVIALGTNDTADVAIGSNTGRLARIKEMMAAAHGQPVMWVNTISTLVSGPYSEANMQAWNAALLQACPHFKNMRVLNWASLAKKPWFINDGIHYTSAGYAARGQQIAEGLARAFPAGGRSKGCVVS